MRRRRIAGLLLNPITLLLLLGISIAVRGTFTQTLWQTCIPLRDCPAWPFADGPEASAISLVDSLALLVAVLWTFGKIRGTWSALYVGLLLFSAGLFTALTPSIGLPAPGITCLFFGVPFALAADISFSARNGELRATG